MLDGEFQIDSLSLGDATLIVINDHVINNNGLLHIQRTLGFLLKGELN